MENNLHSAKQSAVLRAAKCGAVAWLFQACSLILWSIMSGRAINIIRNAEEEVGAVLSGPTRFHACMMAIASAFAVATGILFGTALLRRAEAIKHCLHRAHDAATGGLDEEEKQLNSADGLPFFSIILNAVYISFILWACACVLGYARWMWGASAIVDGAEMVLANRAASEPKLVAATRTLSAAIDMEYQGPGCPAACLDLAVYDFMHSTKCVCDTVIVKSLWDSAATLYNQLLASLTLLVAMLGSAGVGLLYTSALFTRADGRSEVDLILDELDRTTGSTDDDTEVHGSSSSMLAALLCSAPPPWGYGHKNDDGAVHEGDFFPSVSGWVQHRDRAHTAGVSTVSAEGSVESGSSSTYEPSGALLDEPWRATRLQLRSDPRQLPPCGVRHPASLVFRSTTTATAAEGAASHLADLGRPGRTCGEVKDGVAVARGERGGDSGYGWRERPGRGEQPERGGCNRVKAGSGEGCVWSGRHKRSDSVFSVHGGGYGAALEERAM